MAKTMLYLFFSLKVFITRELQNIEKTKVILQSDSVSQIYRKLQEKAYYYHRNEVPVFSQTYF